MSWLARREHGSQELRRKLIGKGCPAAVADQTVEQLQRERLLSDERFLESLVRARRTRGYGPLRIRKELRDKGVTRDAIERGLDAARAGWDEDIERVRRKKFGARRPKNMAERARQARFLKHRGFTFDQIQQVLNPREVD